MCTGSDLIPAVKRLHIHTYIRFRSRHEVAHLTNRPGGTPLITPYTAVRRLVLGGTLGKSASRMISVESVFVDSFRPSSIDLKCSDASSFDSIHPLYVGHMMDGRATMNMKGKVMYRYHPKAGQFGPERPAPSFHGKANSLTLKIV
jgi:hypothetical protein